MVDIKTAIILYALLYAICVMFLVVILTKQKRVTMDLKRLEKERENLRGEEYALKAKQERLAFKYKLK